ncbi:MAG: hypothetical protein KAI17_13635 [Thiotrichaceae bacterium]|nr:hypothetical protein [Thiotrichaceae bacterium]
MESFDLDSSFGQELDDSIDEAELENMDLSLADDMDLDLGDLEALDDETEEANSVDNKLDLARAYIDMEDIDSATSLLDEVISEGDEGQQVQAKILQQQATSK